ncbi:hypothetical protein F0562_005125 [Nyssa sinensis]|uniref:Uncharacterized protein n=1 Tax=Nyssa sinensis TaxID=561372 RepID=A0A5J5ALB0_9ASTE|nr:hypothetical protein F0562_005125 [Nyssa sinensis]
MSGVQDQPRNQVQESILAQWPKEKENGAHYVIFLGELQPCTSLFNHHLWKKKRKCRMNQSRTSVFVLYYKLSVQGLGEHHLQIKNAGVCLNIEVVKLLTNEEQLMRCTFTVNQSNVRFFS